MAFQLLCGAIAAGLYFATVVIASLTWPGYSHVTQYASELGSAAAPLPWLFNGGILLAGLFGVLGSVGLFRYFRAQGRPLAGGIAAVALACWAIGLLFGGWFPMPNPLHNGFGVMLGVVLLPPALLAALRGRRHARETAFLVAWMVLMYALLLVMFGVGALVATGNVGLWQRAFALTLIGGIGAACLMLRRRALQARISVDSA